MTETRREKLQNEIFTLEDAILYAEGKGVKKLEEAKNLLNRARTFFEQGTWSSAERELSKAVAIKDSKWFLEFIERREKEKGRAGEKAAGSKRFVGDGLCDKYGHVMVKIRLSNVRWYYQCRLCGKRGKYQAIK